MSLYHRDIRLPEGYVHPTARVELHWTNHAKSACVTDRYGVIKQFATIPLSQFETIEVETTGPKVTKVVVRGRMTTELDLIFVLIPNGSRPWTVKTVWLQEHGDNHASLDRSRYMK